MTYFLLVYDRLQGKILEERSYPFESRDRALIDRSSLLRSQTDPNVEIVLLGANSYEDLRKTHGRYFMSLAEAASAR